MDSKNFDRITQKFATRRLSRRAAVAQGGTALAATALVAAGLKNHAAAQDATPAPAVDPGIDTSTGDGAKGPSMLFLQTFQGGSITAKDGAEGTFTLQLDGNVNSTVYFSDRPDRIVGTSPTEDFLVGLGFLADNPPNAALVVETANGETDIAVVELFNPVLDPAGMGITYDVTVLGNWQQSLDMGFQEAPTDLATIEPNFGAAQLFIDDCPGYDMQCINASGNIGAIPDGDHDGFCYSWSEARCLPCDPWLPMDGDSTGTSKNKGYWADQCNQRFTACDGSCYVDSVCTGIPDMFC